MGGARGFVPQVGRFPSLVLPFPSLAFALAFPLLCPLPTAAPSPRRSSAAGWWEGGGGRRRGEEEEGEGRIGDGGGCACSSSKHGPLSCLLSSGQCLTALARSLPSRWCLVPPIRPHPGALRAPWCRKKYALQKYLEKLDGEGVVLPEAVKARLPPKIAPSSAPAATAAGKK